MSNKQPPYRLSGEFCEPITEHRYLDSIASQRQRSAQLVVFFSGLLFLAVSFVDYAKLGPVDAYFQLLPIRIGYFVIHMLIAWQLGVSSSRKRLDGLMAIAVIVTTVCISLIPLFRTEDRLVHQMVAVLVVLIIYTVMPARTSTKIIAGALIVVLLPTLLAVVLKVPNGDIASVLSLLVLANMAGFVGSRRDNMQARNAWWQNHLLNEEIEAHKATFAAQQQLEQKLRNQAYTDSLTGTHNRRSFFEHGVLAMKDPLQRNSMALVMLDLDRFKQVNDTYGHHAGDKTLQKVATICQSMLGEKDTLARLGGEEFAILLNNTDAKSALMTAERLCKTIADTAVVNDQDTFSVTVSIGLVTKMNQYHSLDKALIHADTALYEAKQSGRNKVVVYED